MSAVIAALQAARAYVVTNRDTLAACHTGPDGIDAMGAEGVAEDNALITQIDEALAEATGGAA